MTADHVLLVGLFVTMGAAAFTDLRTRRIPNLLTAGGLIVALGVRALPGPPSFLEGIVALALAFAFAIPFFLAGGLGGGDVKLMGTASAFLGLDRLLAALLIMALTGVVMALTAVVRRRVALQTVANLHMVLLSLGRSTFSGWKGAEGDAPLHLEREGAVTIPYGVAIATGALGGWFLSGWIS